MSPTFAHYGVPLWVPEIGGPIDPDNEAHDLIMSVFGGVSKGERNRIKIRVRTAMAAQAQLEGRFLGGRPPHGYRLIDAGPHPNPAKAADGRRLHALALDDPAATVVARIFGQFIAGDGLFAIAESLTRDGIPCPSAHDPGRNKHRCGVAWSKGAVLINPRYTGRQVWNKQRKDEVLLDVNDVALGHTTKMRWNQAGSWIYSDQIVHPRSSAPMSSARPRTSSPGEAVEHASTSRTPPHAHAFGGAVFCGVCQRRMQGQWINQAPYYRCRFPAEYALANKVAHPRNVYLREDAFAARVTHWLTGLFAPGRLEQTIDQMTAAQDATGDVAAETARAKVADAGRKMARYKAAIDAGGDLEEISTWISDTKAQRLAAEAELRRATTRTQMTRQQIADLNLRGR